MKEENECDRFFKGIVVGSGEYVTPLLEHFRDPNGHLGIGIYDLTYNTVLNNENITLQLWNLSSQQRFRTITSSYFRSAHILLVVFSFTDANSFSEVKSHVSEIDRYAPDNAVKILVATDAELLDQRAVDLSTAKQFAENYGFLFFEVISKQRESVMSPVMGGIQRAMLNFPQVNQVGIAEAQDEELEAEGGNSNNSPRF